MKLYLGSRIIALSAIVSPFFVLGPLFFAAFVLCSEISFATIFLMLGCCACAFIWGVYILNSRNLLYTWGFFYNQSVDIKTLWSKKRTIVYGRCKSCGIGFYTHGILNSRIGSKDYYIFLSYDTFDETYRQSINLWKPSSTQIKVKFNHQIYQYLITVLPRKQACMLQRDYDMYLGGQGDKGTGGQEGTRGRFCCLLRSNNQHHFGAH